MALRSITRSSGQKTLLSTIVILGVITIASAMIIAPTMTFSGYAQEEEEEEQQEKSVSVPRLRDSALGVELVADGLQYPTSMDFIGNDGNMIILQKENGEAVLVSTNGTSQNDDLPVVIDVPVNSDSERGFLGIAVADFQSDNNGKTYVFLYFTESNEEGSEDESNEENPENIRNRVYRYEWDVDERTLIQPVLILDLPAEPGPNHDGGKLIVTQDERNASGTDNPGDYHLYAVIGDLNRDGMLQNFKDASDPDDTSVVLRLTPDGAAASDNPFFTNANNDDRLSKYFAYGIRNSFGMDVDPLTGTLWMTENGPANYDEINVVKPGFNSGWQRIVGPVETSNKTTDDLVQLEGSHYADPVFSWRESVGITDIEFLDSTKLGANYANNIFVGDFKNGNLYFFTINEGRTGIAFEDSSMDSAQNDRDSLLDLVAHNPNELSATIFGTGFRGGITDIETGPDGYLYILTLDGQLYRIVPRNQ